MAQVEPSLQPSMSLRLARALSMTPRLLTGEAAERATFVRWINHHLARDQVALGERQLVDLSTDVWDGSLLYRLAVVLTGTEARPLVQPGARSAKVAVARHQATLALLAAAQGVTLVYSDTGRRQSLDRANGRELQRIAKELAAGRTSTVVAVVWAMVMRFEVCRGLELGEGQPVKQLSGCGMAALLDWVRATALLGGIPLPSGRGLWGSGAFSDGRALAALLHGHSPERFPLAESDAVAEVVAGEDRHRGLTMTEMRVVRERKVRNHEKRLTALFSAAEQELGVPQARDPIPDLIPLT